MGWRLTAILAAAVWLAAWAVCAVGAEDLAAGEAVVRGVVRGAGGEPIEGATVLINRYEGGRLEPAFPTTTSDDEGRYELRLRLVQPVVVKEVWASRSGWVRTTHSERFELAPQQEAALDFRMEPGLVLAGKVEVPPQAGRAGPRQFVLQVAGDGFEQIHLTEAGGEFELFVPPGSYSIHVLSTVIRSANVAAGTTGLVLKREPVELTEEVLGRAFDTLWQAMDGGYSYFAYKPEVDWHRLREIHRPRAVAATTVDEFVGELAKMLSPLRDMHVWLETERGVIGTHGTPWQRNWNPAATMRSWDSSRRFGTFAVVGRTKPDGFGFVVLAKQSDATEELVRQTVAEIQSLGDVPGFIVDLRGGASGGSEPLAQRLAQAFCGQEVVYAKHKYRNGPAHDDFGDERTRSLTAGERPFTRPVVCLIGPRCMSSGEGLVKMMDALPHVTLVGMRTRGSSGNPKPVRLEPLDVQVWFSRWVDMQPDGTVVEGNGIAPDVEVDLPIEAYDDADPTWQRALEVLREKVGRLGDY